MSTPLLDENTPLRGTPISEWLRRTDNEADGCSIHEVRNLLAGLVSIRYQATFSGWTEQLVASDEQCERQLRLIVRKLRRPRLFFCNATVGWCEPALAGGTGGEFFAGGEAGGDGNAVASLAADE